MKVRVMVLGLCIISLLSLLLLQGCQNVVVGKAGEMSSCGNGNVEAPEECDDGNTEINDACNGECKKQCFDSDGKEKNTVGTVQVIDTLGNTKIYPDVCSGTKEVIEYSCGADVSVPLKDILTCDKECRDGACVICTDTDGGSNFQVKGQTKGLNYQGDYVVFDDRCDGSKIDEGFCSQDTFYYIKSSCSFGCYDGACLTQEQAQCTDSDNGQIPELKGVTQSFDSTLGFLTSEDRCEGSKVIEFSCTQNKQVETPIDCPYGCVEGFCLTAEQVCQDSDQTDPLTNDNSQFTKGHIQGVDMNGKSVDKDDICNNEQELK
ncbi:MAG: hypothetical protein Q7J78_06745, partial [Clostridiales bacterium]|nr:hypothetical protein [Clostridiales bacterium]